MFKVCLLIALAIAGTNAQNAPPSEAAAEPYSYGYDTDSHSAAEQRDPNGRVTGYYTLVDNDGRQRRVDYVADEAGFRAKVQTNEVGTKSENSADVETLAAPPTREQLVYQAPVVQQTQRVVAQQVAPAQSARAQQVSYVQQPYGYGYGYYPGYGASSQYGYAVPSSQYGYSVPSSQYGYVAPSGQYGYGVASSPSYGYGYYNNGVYGGYNNHLPSSYYKSISSGSVQPATYGAGTGFTGSTIGNYRGYQTVGVPAVSYQSSIGPSRATYQTGAPTSNVASSNYIVLKKRASDSVVQEDNNKNKN